MGGVALGVFLVSTTGQPCQLTPGYPSVTLYDTRLTALNITATTVSPSANGALTLTAGAPVQFELIWHETNAPPPLPPKCTAPVQVATILKIVLPSLRTTFQLPAQADDGHFQNITDCGGQIGVTPLHLVC
jgi:hypothetical protein